MKMCDCIKDMDAKLADLNGKIAVTIGFGFDGTSSGPYPTIEVEKINKRGKRPPVALPSYCPFCGERYPRKP
jgi:hypothetical protein